MTTYVRTGLVTIPDHVEQEMLDYEFSLMPGDQLHPLGMKSEMWITHQAVERHTDSQPYGYITMGLILCNGNNSRLVTEDGEFALPVGSIYRIDPSKPHGTVADDSDGHFSFLAWDFPADKEMTAEQFAVEALASIKDEFRLAPTDTNAAWNQGYGNV